MAKAGKAPTMKDVAREAGVALGTVSKVFNDLPVGESYRRKVEAAAERLGYRVNSYARGLRANRTHTVALILPTLDHPYFARLANHVNAALTQRDYRLMISVTYSDILAEARCLEMLRQNMVDGVIGLTYSSSLNVGDNLPYVSLDRFISPNIPCVASDNFAGGRMAAEKLMALGCKRLLYLRTGSSVPGETDKRGAGFAAQCQAAGASFDMKLFNHGDECGPVFEYIDARVREDGFGYDGIFCCADYLACSVRCKLEALGRRVPEDVQIIGFDGTPRFDSSGENLCSAIVQPIQQIAETAVRLLLDRRPEEPAGLVCLPVTYAPGGTTRE